MDLQSTDFATGHTYAYIKKKPPQWLLFTTSPTGFSLFFKLDGADRTWTCIVQDKALIYLYSCSTIELLHHIGAGRGNRTLKFSLEGWCFTVKLYLHKRDESYFHPFALKSILGINAFNKTYVFHALVEKHLKTPLRYVESHANFSFFILDKSWCPVQNKSICIVPILTLLTHHLGFQR